MIETWRWFGPDDPVTLEDVRQAGATGIVTALHDQPNGTVWSVEAITERRDMIAAAGLKWEVVESVPVHEDIKRGAPGWEDKADAWAQSLRNLAACGIRTVCYNFMPLLDWTRTDLTHALPDGALCLRYDAVDAAVFDIHILGREAAAADHHPEIAARAATRHAAMSEADCQQLTRTIIAGLPGAEESFDLDSFRAHLAMYDGIDTARLRSNLAAFLRRVVPVAEEEGVTLGIHPDDPPFPIFGLPRVVSTAEDLQAILDMVDSPANGLTFCTGSLGVRADNDLPAMLTRFGPSVAFLHLRATLREADGISFHEAPHLAGDVDMVAICKAALEAETAQGRALPFRPDHGHMLAHDQRTASTPGYPYIGRLRGLAELRGILHTLAHSAAI
ncbi:mannonate dehydratase [Epibacterium sp. MM17-32]|uniref:mannonate dehydratase n=1 Tax=Epibacterium sp. MM17-32 TaxID=2917734 RepID=UPI001EF60BA8|nr:mannonate dehydratase [Epibacterium sp. MM17-32]MCG7626755.1 mannonate dehydratase [Epibacterium sp. MM17-32]